jgi:uncharacterized protein YaeQ
MLYRFQVELSDIDRGVYETLDFRIAQHPSEIIPFLLTRTLAYLLCYQDGLEFPPGGLADPDQPALRVVNAQGSVDLWIEIGNPSTRKLHRASKAANRVVVYTYKKPEILIKDIISDNVHGAEEIEIYAFEPKFLTQLESSLEKNNRWSVLMQDGQLDVTVDGQIHTASVKRISIDTSKPS